MIYEIASNPSQNRSLLQVVPILSETGVFEPATTGEIGANGVMRLLKNLR